MTKPKIRERKKQYIVLEDGRRFRLIHEKRPNKHYLGEYDPKTRTIRIMTPKALYNAVLDHEVRHAASPIMSFFGLFFNWQVFAFAQVIFVSGVLSIFSLGAFGA